MEPTTIDFNNTFEPDSIDPVTEVPQAETSIPPLDEPINEESPVSEPTSSNEELLLSKLDPIPVFAITDEQGVPLVAASEENKDMVTGVFISKDDANQFVEKLKTENPELAKKVKVVLSSLGKVYELSESAKGQENALSFAYVPEAEAVTDAKTITQGEEQSYQGGVPLFVATGGENQDPLSIEQNSQKVIPFFFDKQELEEVLDEIKQQQPEIADSVSIDVILLENVIETLKTSEDETLADIVLIPSVESIEAAQSLQGGRENVYRFLNQNTGVHFYTASEAEKDNIVENLPNFNLEGVSYEVVDPLTGAENTDVVHRFLNQDTGVHIYTIDENERSFIAENLSNYTYEGEVFAAYTSQVEGTIPIHRFYNSQLNTHFYTPSETERESIENGFPDYNYEGIAYYAFAADV